MVAEWEPTRTLLRRLRWSLVHPLATRLNGQYVDGASLGIYFIDDPPFPDSRPSTIGSASKLN